MMQRINWTSFVALGLVCIAVLAVTEGASVDCRRFVFAPACRGATIKRSNSIPELPRELRLSEGELFEQYQQSDANGDVEDMPPSQRPLKGRWPLNNRHRLPVQFETDD